MASNATKTKEILLIQRWMVREEEREGGHYIGMSGACKRKILKCECVVSTYCELGSHRFESKRRY